MAETQEELHGFDGRVKLKKHDDTPKGNWIDLERTKLQAYEYLCHIGEAKEWIEACIHAEIGKTENLAEELRNGIFLAKLAKAFHPASVKRIFEDTSKLQFRHSDNINFFFQACKNIELPDVFLFELIDLYDKKNIPKVIYCIHALSHLLHKKGLAPRIKDLLGKLQFADNVLDSTAQGLEESGVAMPAFGGIQDALAKEMDEPSEEELRAQHFQKNLKSVIKCQAIARGRKQQKIYASRKLRYKSKENLVSKLQAIYKGKLQRQDFVARKNYFNKHVGTAIKLQAWWRGQQASKQYKALRMHAGGTDSKTLQQYIKLLDDNSDDFGDERQLDKLRIAVVKHIRENQVTENQVNELDSKIALLVKNRITLEEVVHFSSKQMRSHLAHEVAQQHEREGGVITLKGNDKETKNKRQRYEEMFYLLQTQPQYLSKLMFTMNKTSGSGATKFLEGAVLTMYGYVQNSREEYLFLNLIDSSLVIEIEDLEKIDDFWKDNPLFIKLALQYIRGAKERKFLRDFLQPLVKGVLGDANLDLETDAQKVHKELIRSEEIRTGEKSTISADISAADAAELPAVKALITERFANLKRITNSFLAAIVNSLSAMPFGIRYVANKMKEHLSKRFPGHEHELEINRILGNLLYYRYINPAIIAPDAFDVIESSTISPVQRKNLAEVAKVLNSIQSSRTIPGADMLNEFITSATGRFSYFIKEATQVESLDEFFGMNEFVDMSLAVKPTIYITPDEIIQIHCNLVENISQICQGDQDPLKVILTEMGTAPTLDSGAKGPGSELTLHLTNRFAKSEHPEEARNRQLISEAKILIQAIVRISAGKSLLKILETPVDADMQSSFTHFLEASQKRLVEGSGARSSESVQINAGTSLHYLKNSDDSFFTFAQLKCRAIEKMAELEQLGLCTQKDEYQSMMDSIVEDMLNKQRRRSQRKREMKVLLSTLSNLQEKAAFLGDQKKSYDDYISACMQQLQSKTKTKTKKPMLFSKQYYHVRDLQKSGKMPQFGSFKYTAAELHKKGVLISVEDYSPKQFGGITLTLSSDEAGVFKVDAQFLGVNVSEPMEIRLEDLLQSQYNKVDEMLLFDIAKVNLNLLIFLINKKFYV